MLFDSLFKVLFIFRSLYLCAIGLQPVFSLGRSIPPVRAAFPNYSTRRGSITWAGFPTRRGSHPLWRPVPGNSEGTRARRILCKLQLGPPREPDFKFELLPLHSPLLRQSLLVSFPPLIDMLKFSGYSYLIRGQLSEVGCLTAWPPPRSNCEVVLLRRGGLQRDRH